MEAAHALPWTEDLKIESLDEDSKIKKDESSNITFSIASFNVLAEAYLTERSHKNLPDDSANVVFKPERRIKLLCNTLEKLAKTFDIICLQELDHALQETVFNCFSKIGFGHVYAPRGDSSLISTSNANISATRKQESNKKEKTDRTDGCATFYSLSKWKCIRNEVVHFDDLAEDDRPLFHDNESNFEQNEIKENESKASRKQKKNKRPHALSGIIASYRRRNVALLIEFEQRQVDAAIAKHVIVANTHLYWNPGYEYVKLSQAHYLLHRLKRFASDSAGGEGEPVVMLCGDFNSTPGSSVYNYLTKGLIDARTVAPWHNMYDEMKEQKKLAVFMKSLSDNSDNFKNKIGNQDPVGDIRASMDNTGLDRSTAQMQVEDADDNITSSEATGISGFWNKSGSDKISSYEHSSADANAIDDDDVRPIKYLLDITLNKFGRWLRILGLDATLESVEEEKLRTGEGNMLLFERCRKEKRNLITTSKTLLLRKDCPAGAYLVNPSNVKALEDTLVRLLRLYGVVLKPRKFLTRCVVCNGLISEVFDINEQKAILKEFATPDLLKEISHIYKCKGCGQGYWWSSEPSSSASRIKDTATHLLRVCLRGGVKIDGQPEFFEFVDYNFERRSGTAIHANGNGGGGIEEVVSWLKDKSLKSPFSFKSAYVSTVDGNADGELLPFTNVTSDFVGALDYIFYEDSKLSQIGRLAVPTDFRTLNTKQIKNGHLLPSDKWPSDHLCVGAQFSLKYHAVKVETKKKIVPLKYHAVKVETNKNIAQTVVTNNDKCGNVSNYISPFGNIPGGYMPIHICPLPGNCACVPSNIPSLFQMAELRKQARAKKEAEAKKENS
mmetsp:Transcript_3820/g.8009  ORF Transcript_3820/g.8009 Transcript_3820/m.8009 type:complete len:840 (+) Transcript_3820:174-2693(+)